MGQRISWKWERFRRKYVGRIMVIRIVGFSWFFSLCLPLTLTLQWSGVGPLWTESLGLPGGSIFLSCLSCISGSDSYFHSTSCCPGPLLHGPSNTFPGLSPSALKLLAASTVDKPWEAQLLLQIAFTLPFFTFVDSPFFKIFLNHLSWILLPRMTQECSVIFKWQQNN